MGRYGSGFREPPWVMGSPKEVMEWMEDSHPSKKIKDRKKTDRDFLQNLHIKFDFDVNKKQVDPPNMLMKLFSRKMIEEDFELFNTTELILRGLAKAKFRNTAKIVIDGKTIYEHPEKKSDLRKTIDDIGEFSSDITKGKNVIIIAILADTEKSTATIKINKIHSPRDHSVDIKITGKIRKELYHTFLNYLNEKIGLKKEN
jgi:hypothetical protein